MNNQIKHQLTPLSKGGGEAWPYVYHVGTRCRRGGLLVIAGPRGPMYVECGPSDAESHGDDLEIWSTLSALEPVRLATIGWDEGQPTSPTQVTRSITNKCHSFQPSTRRCLAPGAGTAITTTTVPHPVWSRALVSVFWPLSFRFSGSAVRLANRK